MNDLTILHLSDLHIDGQAAYPEILKNLLVHIKEEIATTREKTLVVAVTGDIIDKGNKAAIDNAKKFFEDLKKTLGNKVAGIVLVPGNHDIFRSNSCKFIIPACRTFAVQKEYERSNTEECSCFIVLSTSAAIVSNFVMSLTIEGKSALYGYFFWETCFAA